MQMGKLTSTSGFGRDLPVEQSSPMAGIAAKLSFGSDVVRVSSGSRAESAGERILTRLPGQ